LTKDSSSRYCKNSPKKNDLLQLCFKLSQNKVKLNSKNQKAEMMKMFREILSESAKKFSVELSEIQLEQFEIFYKLVVQWNEKINLTAITDEKDFAVKHIIDSLSLWNAEIFSDTKKVIDIGTGAGFPGVPLKIFKPELEIVLLDSLSKRIDFLKKVVTELNLKNVTCIHGRAEDFARQKNFREQFDLATTRAVARLNIIAEYCLPFVKVGGIFVALKGKQFAEEISEAKSAVKILGGGEITFAEKILPELPDKRAVIYIDKKKSTPKKFPRKAGTPSKSPLM